MSGSLRFASHPNTATQLSWAKPDLVDDHHHFRGTWPETEGSHCSCRAASSNKLQHPLSKETEMQSSMQSGNNPQNTYSCTKDFKPHVLDCSYLNFHWSLWAQMTLAGLQGSKWQLRELTFMLTVLILSHPFSSSLSLQCVEASSSLKQDQTQSLP